MATITITHSRLEGTLITDSVRGDGVWEVVKNHGFRPFPSIGALGIPRSRDNEADTWRIKNATRALEAAGHTVNVEIDEGTRRTFAEAEADRVERAEGRTERYEGYADNAASSSNARRARADDISRRFEFGQPILVGHHSEGKARRDAARIDTNMRKSFEDADRASHWQHRADAAAAYEQHRNDPYRTLRRLENLRAGLRVIERRNGGAADDEQPTDRDGRIMRDLREEITHWEEVVAKAEANGVKIWRPDDFAPGDFVRTTSSWYQVARVNPKSLSIAWNLRLAPKQVMSLEDATFDGGRVGTFTVDYTNVRARCPEKAMAAFLADGKVPGTKSAGEASAQAPAEDIRRAQVEAKKARPKTPKKRSDPKIPKRVQIECELSASEATLTWLNGNSQPHPGHKPETITAPEGEKYHRATWSRNLMKQVDELLADRGYERTGKWKHRRGRGEVAAIVPAPAKGEPKQEEMS
ncbi:DUF3560 domain-containing protein [Streptomyces sp. NA04227]|uniref:DUF3560 domain-containing protein n=1 Tax=Streptomyces sp. NA04227 TaxID=2742136 RepID=UPI001590A1AB|nr:DUF3560 domain-containing protein [Streptomyces sp. NA04227]QKW06961.1 DUF3560 domain-containing protein [Streptomyces sp. NA04227]